MSNDITQLIKQVPVLSPDDTIRRAVGLIRASESSSVLVAQGNSILGQINEDAIATFLATTESEQDAMSSSIEPLVQGGLIYAGSFLTLKQAADLFSTNKIDMMPVVDSFGSFFGVLFRRDVLAALTNNLRPPSVAGMATPLGVYLTTGSHSGGAGSRGLFLTGASLMMMMAASSLIVDGITKLAGMLTGIRLDMFLMSVPLTTKMNVYDLVLYATLVLNAGGMLLLLRLSPLSGYHAAEHMTVHAIEAGEELSPDRVRHMPRVHPRCGTNLLAAASIFLLITSKVDSGLAMLMALVVVMLGWRTVGSLMQSIFTTKPPTEKQLANGVAAGNELLKRYAERPNHQTYGFERVWNMGFLQTASGMMAAYTVLWMLQSVTHVRLLPM